MTSFKEFLKFVDETFNSFNWRYGQCIMNVLHATNPKIYKKLVATEFDCYYKDNLTDTTITLKEIQRNWEAQQ